MAKSSSSNSKQRKHEKVRAQVVSKLEEMEAEVKDKYQQAIDDSLKQNMADEVSVKDVAPVMLGEKFENVEVNEMAKNFDFNADEQNFGEGAEETPLKVEDMPEGLPTVKDDSETIEEQTKETETKDADDKATTGKYDDIEELAKKNISNWANISAKAASVVKLLKDNMMIKQFITTAEFGRGMVLAKQNIAGKSETRDNTAHFKIENLKPGRAKAVVVTLPKALQEVLTASANKKMNALRDVLASSFPNGELTAEQKADTVDMVMAFDDLMVRVANLCEGRIAEFDGVDGQLSVAPASKTLYKTDALTGVVTTEAKDVSANQVVEIINGKKHVMYTMAQPNSALMKKVLDGEVLGDKDSNVIERYKKGKTPLKRVKGAYSALYTNKNYTSASRYVTAKPFAAGLTKDDAETLSRKAVYQYKKHDSTAVRVESYDTAMVDGDMLKVFDPSIDAKQRYEMLTVAKGYVRTKQGGTPYMRSIPDIDPETGKKKGMKQVTETPHDKTLVDRIPKDFYTGAKIENIESIEFVTYGMSGKTKKDNKDTAPRARKNRISFAGLEAELSETKGIVGKFDIKDASVSRLVELTSETVAKEAFIKALTRKSNGKDNNVGSEYDDGVLSALLASR